MDWMGLPEQDQPPEEIWLDSAAISDHFKAVRARYAERAGGAAGASDDFQQNDYTKDIR